VEDLFSWNMKRSAGALDRVCSDKAYTNTPRSNTWVVELDKSAEGVGVPFRAD